MGIITYHSPCQFEACSKVHTQNAAFSLKGKCPVHEALFRKGLSISKLVVLCSVYNKD